MRAIRAAHAFDGSRFLPDGATVVWDEDRIVGVESGCATLPESVEVSDYGGTVLPGLIDCHSHLVADATVGGLERAAAMPEQAIDQVIAESLATHAVAGVTTVRDLGDRAYRTLAFGERAGLPRVVASGPPITTPGEHCHFLGGAVGGSDLGTSVAEHAERGVDVIKVMASGGFATPGSDQFGAQYGVAELTNLVDTAHETGLPVVAHAHSLLGIQHALAAGVDGIEHFTGLAPEGARIGDGLLEAVARRGLYVDLTMGNDRTLHAAMPAPPPPLAALLASLGFTSLDALYDFQLSVLGRLREHGVVVVTGVDSGMAPPKQHGNVWRAVSDMVEAGYPVADALAAATSVAARVCGLENETGRLAAGCAADLLVVDGELSKNPLLLGSPQQVIMRGLPLPLGVRPLS
ncbi:amidohydrolase family protein [Nocardioides sp.]|uniref:amidohydrolase family protein n=1 Tax=Nocardioides sp. TaxID=35761 RepID=UPI002ED2E63A